MPGELLTFLLFFKFLMHFAVSRDVVVVSLKNTSEQTRALKEFIPYEKNVAFVAACKKPISVNGWPIGD